MAKTWDQKYGAQLQARNAAIDRGVAARNEGIARGAATRGEKIDRGVAARNDAITRGVEARNKQFETGRPSSPGAKAPTTSTPARGSGQLAQPVSNGRLSSLKIGVAPKAFERFAAKHDALVEMLERTEGANGAEVQMTPAKMLISMNPTALSGAGVGGVGVPDPLTINRLNANYVDVAVQMNAAAIQTNSFQVDATGITVNNRLYTDGVLTICSNGSPTNVYFLMA